jgi:chorismate lyase / 3-hydroxybenzoate synthase
MPARSAVSRSGSVFGVAFESAPPASTAPQVQVALPWLSGIGREEVFGELEPAGSESGVALFRRDGLLVGHAREPFVDGDVEGSARRVYDRVLAVSRGHQLYRFWNYVPRINVVTAGLENYRAFCRGRSLAFETAFGAGFQSRLPAASAVGSDGDTLDVIFAAGEATPRHVENPEQIPAYEYPREHGPRSPSFSRATVVAEGGTRFVFLSGTAAIKGHVTIAPGKLEEQIACTLDNLRLISRACDVGENLGAESGAATGEGGWTRHFKVYLRRHDELARAKALLEGALFTSGDRVTWLRSDICRAELNIEIEATLIRHA